MDNFNFTHEDVKEYTNVFNELELESIVRYLERPQWRFGHISSTDKYRNLPPFWSMSLINDEFFTEHLLNKIQEITGDELELLTVYSNGQTYGQGGQPHPDCHNELGRTFLFYSNTHWDIRWNGNTVFLFDDAPKFVVPAPNKAVYFPGIIPHFAQETTRPFGGLRTTIAWKLQLKTNGL